MITIFTPSYNRCNNLKKLYNSLIEQTDKDFMWYVIDDGSTDNTSNYIESLKKENKINIIYLYKKNEGKHSTFNKLFSTCPTKYFLCVDSDDYLLPDAIKIINNKLLSYFDDDIWGVTGPRKKENGQLYSQWKIGNNYKLKFCELYSKYKYVGDTYIIMDVEKIKRYKFPVYPNEKLVPENVLYDFLDNKYYIKSSSYQFYVGEYISDGYTKNANKLLNNSPNGIYYANISTFNNRFNSPKVRILAFSRYESIKTVFKLKVKNIPSFSFSNLCIILLGIIIYPIFCIHYWRKKVK